MEAELKIPELLAPAGNMEKLQTAARFGADAVYMGLEGFSLRNRAGNVSAEELVTTVAMAHELGVRFYLAVNLVPFDRDLENLKAVLPQIRKSGTDAVIVSDAGMVQLFREQIPDMAIHLSTQANVTNAHAARFWLERGVERIILARELSIEQIRHIRNHCEAELEVFVHGALCISWSGRCFLSRYMADRDANRGDCAQSCRWSYQVLEESKRPGQFYPIESDEQGSYIFNARDLCALPVLDRLVEAGPHSLKLEGRMKSVHYVAVVVDVYRSALDLLKKGKDDVLRDRLPDMMEELKRVSNRGFTLNAFDEGDGEEDRRIHTDRYDNAEAFVGTVVNSNGQTVDIALRNKVSPGEILTFVEPGLRRHSITIESIMNLQNQWLPHGQTGTTVRLGVSHSISEGAIVRR